MKRKKLCSFMMILGLGTGIFVNNTCVLAEDNLEEKIIDIKDKLPKIMINLVYIEKYLTIAPKFFIENYLKININ